MKVTIEFYVDDFQQALDCAKQLSRRYGDITLSVEQEVNPS